MEISIDIKSTGDFCFNIDT